MTLKDKLRGRRTSTQPEDKDMGKFLSNVSQISERKTRLDIAEEIKKGLLPEIEKFINKVADEMLTNKLRGDSGAEGKIGAKGGEGREGTPGKDAPEIDPLVVARLLSKDSEFANEVRGKDGINADEQKMVGEVVNAIRESDFSNKHIVSLVEGMTKIEDIARGLEQLPRSKKLDYFEALKDKPSIPSMEEFKKKQRMVDRA